MSDLFFLIFGIIVGVIGLIVLMTEVYSYLTCRDEVDAKIVDHKVQSNFVRGTVVHMFSPIFAYEIDGKTYTGISPFSSRFEEKWPLDSTMKIFVSKKNPEHYRFKGKKGGLIFGSIVTAIGLLFIILYFV